MTTKEILQKAKSLIDTPEKWMQHDWIGYRDKTRGEPKTQSIKELIAIKDEIAFCSWGTIVFLNDSGEISSLEFNDLLNLLNLKSRERFKTGIIDYNDTPGRTHKEIMDLFDSAINELD